MCEAGAKSSVDIRPTGILEEGEAQPPVTDRPWEQNKRKSKMAASGSDKVEIQWTNVFFIGGFHVLALYGVVAVFEARWPTLALSLWAMLMAGFGTSAGAHRYWSHKAFKARLPLHLFLLLGQTISMLDSAYTWALEHRLHHKYSETDADPKNSNNGIFFSQWGWFIFKKHPAVVEKIATIDARDLLDDPWVRVQHLYWHPLALFVGIVLPTWIPWRFWGEDPVVAFLVCVALRYVVIANLSWSLNSIAHRYGHRPYDKTIRPVDSMVVQILTAGEGWHNYHHVFPWDYRSSELGFQRLNFTTRFIDVMAAVGLAYDLKTANPAVVKARAARTGDGSRAHFVAPFIKADQGKSS